MAADGTLLPIQQNQALFSILGTTYGGDGKSTFALPDLRGRVAVGADATDPLGAVFGQDATTLTAAQLPGGGVAGSTSPGQPVTNYQPSLALNYLIATSGIFPPRDSGNGFDPNNPTLGQIVEFAGNFAPSGWAFANGQ
jgi:microcystin-dependent protein